jgi:hypothetical protein
MPTWFEHVRKSLGFRRPLATRRVATRYRPRFDPLEERAVPTALDWAEPDNNTRTSATYLGRGGGLNWGGLSIHGSDDVDWLAFTATLQVLEYDGFLVVEREQGENKLADVEAGVKFLRRFAAPIV